MPEPQKNRILLTGPTGQVGFELLSRLSRFGAVLAFNHSQLDLASAESIRSAVRSVQPKIIVNAAAYTAVDRAESESELALQVNGIAPGILAEEANRCRALLIHYSTDYVFDGNKRTPYVEEDETAPLNCYGRTKLTGEQSIARIGGAYVILRTSWVYASRGSNFFLTMLRLGVERETLRIVDDQIGSPTPAATVADATMAIIQRYCSGASDAHENALNFSGIYHATCAGQTSWFEFAHTIFDEARKSALGSKLKVSEIAPIPTAEYPTPARRPQYSILSNEKMIRTFAFQPPAWQEGLTTVMPQLAQQKSLNI